MSRCFPFPPPGYVRKTVPDGSDVVNKEKHKEKKHKKEKKDKEKKEGKEKRERARSDEKHKEKKEKKEKHRDKRKDKEKDQDKDKYKSELLLSDEKAVISTDNHVHKHSENSKKREIDRNATSTEKRIGGVCGFHNGVPIYKDNPQNFDKNVSAERKKDGVGGNRALEKKIERKEDGRENFRETEGQNRKGERRKEKDRERPILKDGGEEEEKMKARTHEEKYIQMMRIKGSGENKKLNVKDTNKDNITKDNNSHAVNVNNIRKRKDPGLNGIYDELVIAPNKLARRPVSHTLTVNGRSLEPCQNSSAPMDIKVDPKLPHVDSTQKPPMRIKVDSKECKVNGTISEPCTKSSREKVSKAERKSHPDTKYLNKVLSLPKMDEWSNAVDQEWLFESNSSTRKPDVNSSSICEMPQPQVWERGMWLEPVDVYALPYVIPH